MTLLERCDEVSHPALSVCAQLVDENVHTERARTTIHALLLYLSLKPDHAMLRRKYGTVRVSKRFPTGPACPLATILSVSFRQAALIFIISLSRPARRKLTNDPGEYDSLPTAVVAEELGLSIGLVEALIQYGEIEPTDTTEESRRDRVSRDELARVIEFGLDELLRLHEQDAAQIFEDALRHLQDGDLEAAEKAYRRIEVRDSLIGHYAMAYRIGLDLAKSNFDEAKSTIDFVLREEQIERTATLSYLARLLRSIRFNEHTAEVTREHLLALADGGEFDPYRYAGSYSSKQIGKHLDETQQRAMYVATAVDQALKNYKFRNQFLRFNDRNSPLREEEFNSIESIISPRDRECLTTIIDSGPRTETESRVGG